MDTSRFERGGPDCEEGGLRLFVRRPVDILRAYRRGDFPADLLAALTVAAVAIPQAIAYASIAELPPHYGLYTAGVAAIVGSLWGCSRFLATGPVNAVSLLVLPVLLGVAVPGSPDFLLAASTVALLAGLFNVVLALLRFGALVTLASHSVLLGFTAGAAIHIAVGQVKHLAGLQIPAMPELHRTVRAIADRIHESHPITLALGLGALVLVIAARRLGPRFPAALATIVVAAVATAALGLEGRGVHVVGAIPRSLPPPTWFAIGQLPDLQMIRGLVVGAMAVAALGLIEAVAASQTLARQAGDRLNNNQEFFGQGLANIAAGLFSGYPCSGSFTRSALAQQSGARTHISGVLTGLTVLVGLLVFAPWARHIPRAAIAGVLLVVAWRMIDREGIRRVFKSSRSEAAVMTITFGATLVLPLDFAVLAGVVFSLAFFVIKSSLPRVVPVVPDPTFRHFVDDPSRPVCPQLGVDTRDSRFVTSPGTVSSDYRTVITTDRSPVWSPDGTTIYFTRFGCPATPISCFTDLMAVEPDTGVTSTVVAHASRTSSALDVSPDGRWLVSVDATIPVPPGSVVLRELTTTTETSLNMGTTVTGSAFSPSGERLAVGLDVSSMTRPSWVWTMDLDGTDRVKVAQGWNPAWQPVNPYPFGSVDPDQGQWHLRHPDGHVSAFYYGNPGDVPFLGDWDCDGIDTPGLYRQSDGYVYLRNTNTQGTADIKFFFGNPGDMPIAGDFNGDGCSTVSVYRPGNQTFYIINELGDDDTGLGAADASYVFGNPGDKPFVGDFDGDGIDTVGLHRESTGLVYFRNTHTQGNADVSFVFGNPGDRLVANDWNDDGNDSPGLFRPASTTVYLRFTNTQGNADARFMFGQSDWLPVTGVFG